MSQYERRSQPPAIKDEMQRQISKCLEEGVIRPSDNPYSSMMWVVSKKSGKNGEKRWRMVTDFRQLNEITVGNTANNTLACETNLNGISLPGESSGPQGMPIVLLPSINPEALRQKEREKREGTESQILYKKGEFLAVRNVDKGFSLCRLNRDILAPKDHVRVQWLTESDDNKQVYTLSYDNNIEFECILTNVNLTKISNYRYYLSKSEWESIDEILKESLERKIIPRRKKWSRERPVVVKS